MDRRGLTTLSIGHGSADFVQGALPALLPTLVAEHGWSYAMVSALVLAMTVTSSIIQPLFGVMSDRRSLSWLLYAGPILAGAGFMLVGVVQTFPVVFALVLISGVGVAGFHPEGSRFANYVSGPRRATGMSLFAVGGNVGFGLGPLAMTLALLAVGPSGTLIVGAIPILLGMGLATQGHYLRRFRPTQAQQNADRADLPEAWGPFARLAGVIALRSVIFFGLVTFVPLYFVHVLDTSDTRGSLALTAMTLVGAVGTLVGGRLADRIGRKPVLLGSMGLLTPLLVCFLLAGPTLATILLGAAGGVTIATFSLTVVMGQEYLPGRLGVASGVTLGLSIGVGGVAATLLGVLADSTSLTTVLAIIAMLPLAALALSATLPSAQKATADAAARQGFDPDGPLPRGEPAGAISRS